VDDLLDVSRITRGLIELRRERVAVASVIGRAIESATPFIAAGRHALAVRLPDVPVWLDADPHRVSQVVTNLLTNAAKYTPPGGQITVEAARDDHQVIIRVRDNGIGLAPDVLPTLFEMFYQVKAPDRLQGGLGIGLALAKRLTELHSGTIEARSAGIGQGAEFVVRLPIAPDAEPLETEPVIDQLAGGRRLKVLIVDDNRDLVEMLAIVVGDLGHEVETASDGPGALFTAKRYLPDVVLLDLGLPGLDGLAVARELRAHPDTAGARLVALTGLGQADDQRRTRDAGFDHHLTKPTDPETLQRLLTALAQSA
jgi:CheY-like chemotaxis protein